MPKAAQNASHPSSSNPLAGQSSHPNVLRRNQVCPHGWWFRSADLISSRPCPRSSPVLLGLSPGETGQKSISALKLDTDLISCRQKCDAKRPCSTCVRSYNHAVSHAPAGTEQPPVLECTFDEPPEHNSGTDAPKTKYERLESRIAELEGLLREKELTERRASSSASPSTATLSATDDIHMPHEGLSQLRNSFNHSPEIAIISSAVQTATSGMGPSLGTDMDLIWSQWPQNLPEAELLKHLVDAFFVFHPHARRLFHYSSFMACLALPPNHPRFPSTPVLHAICAVGALFTPAVTSPPPLSFAEMSPEYIFTQRHRQKEDRPVTFAEVQAKFAKETAGKLEYLGMDLLQVLQIGIIGHTPGTFPLINVVASLQLRPSHTFRYRWAELFLNCAHSLRLCVPLGLNVCPPFHTISKSYRPVSVVPAAKSVVEDETRRNAFWFAYAMERQHGCSNAWALSLDDQDVTQLLPVRSDQFEQGVLVPPKERHMRITLFRARHYAGEDASSSPVVDANEPIDPRRSTAFIELDRTTSNFLLLFPPQLKSPIQGNVVDPTLFAAIFMGHISNIILHEPHADVRRAGCISALKMLTAARAVTDMVCNVWSTSFDISLFEPFISFCFFATGRVFARFLQAAVEQNSVEQITPLSQEFDIIRTACHQMSQRHTIAHCFTKMLDDLLDNVRGSSVIEQNEPTLTRHVSIREISIPSNPLQAAYEVFQESVAYRDRNTIADVFDSLSYLDYGVVPQENSIFGPVVETYNALRELQNGFVQGEITLKIQHCLVTRRGVDLSDIDCVMSHEQALGQCQAFLSKYLPKASKKKMDSTAAAAEALIKCPDATKSAAICSKICVSMFEGLQLLREGIQDEQINFTRFYVIAKNPYTRIPCPLPSPCVHALLRITRATTGAPKMTKLFEQLENNMKVTRVDRRPHISGAPFEDVYFIEVQRLDDENASSWSHIVDCAASSARSRNMEVAVLGVW
ncbi:PDT-domain-containing protein [Dendrothele bispora CBS 962.96]|uniref:PDT-domain-containing protein n=1 Tax=Dendrothele bispora (strain CBS 962.96) TaxID=1314807 RepID=A0A4S8MR73_DENBC|nr:PDT-domain-containing protein [Dendrothele bispora CBS 962.96]